MEGLHASLYAFHGKLLVFGIGRNEAGEVITRHWEIPQALARINEPYDLVFCAECSKVRLKFVIILKCGALTEPNTAFAQNMVPLWG
jgi:hypothetical protein